MARILSAILASTVSLVGVAIPAGAHEQPLDPRSLPSLVEVWHLEEPVDEIILASATLYALGERSVMAIDPATGAVLWRRTVAARECCSSPFGVLGDVVALGDGRHLVLFDRANGKSRGEIELPGDVAELFGMPLIAELIDDAGDYSLAAIDIGSKSIAASVGLSSPVSDLALVDDTFVVSLDGSAEGLARFEGYDAASLALRWTADYPAHRSFSRYAGRLWLSWTGGDCACSSLRPLDLRTGQVGSALPNFPERTWYDSSFAMDFQFDEVRSGESAGSRGPAGSFILLHVDPSSATERWRVTLPGRPRRPLRAPTRVAVPVSLGAGRELLAVLKATSGELEQLAFGLPIEAQQFVLSDSLLIVQEPAGLHAYALDHFGPPEKETRSIGAEVERILSQRSPSDPNLGQVDPRQQLAELSLLGEAACPYVTKGIAGRGTSSIAAAAAFIEATPCQGTGRELGILLGSMSLAVEEEGWGVWKPPLVVLRALGAVGTAAEVPVLGRIAFDPGLDASVRAEAWMALVAIGGTGFESALQILDAVAAPERTELEVPSPLGVLSLVGKPEVNEPFPETRAEQEAYYERSALRYAARGSAALAFPDGARFVVFRGATIGGERDLWLVQIDAAGSISSGPWFTGERLPHHVREDEMLSLTGNAATLKLHGRNGAVLFTFDLAKIMRDGDWDGWTDPVEARLRLDPTAPDSDGDGLLDAVDPAPNAAVRRPRNVEERRELDLFAQLFSLVLGPRSSKDRAALVVWSEAALEWRGRSGPTLTLPPAAWGEFFEEAGEDGIAHLILKPWQPGGDAPFDPADELCPLRNEGEYAYEVSLFRGGLNAVNYCVVLRPAGDRWLIRRFRLVSIS